MAKLQELLGSGRQEVVDELSAALNEAEQKKGSWACRLGNKGCAEYLQSLSGAVIVGVPLVGLKTERAPHRFLAKHLARYGQRHRRIDCGVPREIIQDFLQEQGRLLGTEGKKLMRFLTAGRPLFGKQIAAEAAYGYLAHDEANALMQSLERYARHPHADEDGVEFAEELIECLDQRLAHPRQPDLWAVVG